MPMNRRRVHRLVRYGMSCLTMSGIFWIGHEWGVSGFSYLKVGTALLLFVVVIGNLQTAMDGVGEPIED